MRLGDRDKGSKGAAPPSQARRLPIFRGMTVPGCACLLSMLCLGAHAVNAASVWTRVWVHMPAIHAVSWEHTMLALHAALLAQQGLGWGTAKAGHPPIMLAWLRLGCGGWGGMGGWDGMPA